MPKSNEREYRSMAVMAAVRSEEAESPSYVVEGYATTFNEPYELYDGFFEQIDKNAFAACDMSDVIMQFDHAGMVFARTRNNTLRLEIDEHGLKITADLSSTQQSRQLWEAINTGLVDRMSFAFTIEDDIFNRATNTDTITKIKKLYDVSAVSIPANPFTDISAKRKAFIDGEINKARSERAAKAEAEKRKKLLLLKCRMERMKNA